MTIRMSEFGKAVRKAQLDAYISGKDLAKIVGVSSGFMSSICSGRQRAPAKVVEAIQAYFFSRGVEMDDLQTLANMDREEVSIAGLSEGHKKLIIWIANLKGEISDEMVSEVMRTIKGE